MKEPIMTLRTMPDEEVYSEANSFFGQSMWDPEGVITEMRVAFLDAAGNVVCLGKRRLALVK
jgi:hypothetical protein